MNKSVAGLNDFAGHCGNIFVLYYSGHTHSQFIVTILEGAEVSIGFYGQGGGILRGDTPEGAEGLEGWPRG